MTEAATSDFEALLRRALTPIDPPAELSVRMETRLASIADAAAGELESWELGAMRDPRNWVRPAVAVVAGTAAGVGLVVLRTKARSKQRRKQSTSLVDLAGRTVSDAMREARRVWH